MQTRKSPRKDISCPGHFAVGVSQPVKAMIQDISAGGCRFPVGSSGSALRAGAPVEIYIGATGPHRATVRWLEDGMAGVTFVNQLSSALVEHFRSGQPMPADIAEAPAHTPPPAHNPMRRFC